MIKKFLVIVIIIVAVIILIGLGKQIYAALGADRRLNENLEEVAGLERENKRLKQELAEAETFNSVEEIARNDLNMSLPNETIVVIPDDLITEVLTPSPEPVEVRVPNWEGWMRLFIH